MFSLWIYETTEKNKQARKKLQNETNNASRSTSIDSVLGDDASNPRFKQRALQAEELAQAVEIAARLDQLIVSPPFDKNGSLLLLRANISLWMSDLMMGRQASDEDEDMDSVLGHDEDEAEPREEQLKHLTNCHREVQQAQRFFQRAEASGMKGQASTLASIDMKLRELSRDIDKLHASQHDDTNSSLISDHSISESFSHYV
ncbi:hypothetical protein IQ07DRAFT_601813 [Pyrenochaeta sp. DS3sAY3a]|nr:hypothetical protein IQ07DRAFT_601813 [Pyrenochaeta sp. DS3sAY3a]